MNRYLIVFTLVALFVATGLYAQSDRRAIGNLAGYTDSLGNLMVTSVSAQGPFSARRAIGNLLGRTDANGNLMVALAGTAVGEGTATATPCGVIDLNTTTAQTAANTAETDLYNFVLPANSLAPGINGIRISYAGSTAATATTKTIRAYLGGSQATIASGTINNQNWWGSVTFYRTGVSTQLRIPRNFLGASALTPAFLATTENETAALTIRVTGQNGTANNGEIVKRLAKVECF
jgi:hypothetical protein